MNIKIVTIACTVLLFYCVTEKVEGFSREDPVVITKVGSIRGVRSNNGNYTMFLGIPYARVNETFPFGDTLPVLPFEEVFEAIYGEVRCPQWFGGQITGTLDCLHINIHVPDTASPDNLLPVMIYVFGGRFVTGSAGRFLAGPEYLVKHDVIFVSMGYRLGPYGFMCLDIPEVPGNHGLRDQEKAFNWIKDNIESFGGDINRMTLFGNSAGAVSTGLHLLSTSEKVYRNAILQSGTPLLPDTFHPSDSNLPLRLAAKLGHSTDDIYDALKFLSGVHPHDVIAVDDPNPKYYACAEKIFPNVTAFLSDYPLNLRATHIQGITVMQGHTSEEQLFAIPDLHYAPDMFTEALAENEHFNFEGETLIEAESILRRFYIGDEEINESILWEVVHFQSDFTFNYPALRMIPRYFDGGVEKIYQYVLSYDGTRNYGKILRGIEQFPGAAHADCLGYLFSLQYPGIPEPSAEDQIVLDLMTTMWTNFAKYNNPTPEISELIPVKWEPIVRGSPEYYMEINTKLNLRKAFEHRRMNFWRLFYNAYQKYEVGYNYTRRYSEEEPSKNSATNVIIGPVLFMSVIVHLFNLYQSPIVNLLRTVELAWRGFCKQT